MPFQFPGSVKSDFLNILKKIFLLCSLLFFIFNTGLAQFRKQKSSFSSLDFIYGQKIYQNDFYSQLNQTRLYSLDKMVQFVGIGVSGSSSDGTNYEGKKIFSITGFTALCMIVPRTIVISDSLEGKLRGFNYAASLIGLDIFHKSKAVDLLLHAGFNTGRLVTYDNQAIRQKNPYFSPKISLTPRFRIKNAVISINVEYEYDISKTGWRRTYFAKGNMVNINNYRQGGLSAFVTLGIVIPDNPPDY